MNYIIPTEEFVGKIYKEYGDLWNTQNIDNLLEDVAYKVNEIFGVDGIHPK